MQRQPHVIFIMADQLKARALGCYGDPVIRTPHIDRIAGQGLLFENCFAQNGICVPSRSSFLTGRYVHCHGAWANRFALSPRELHLGCLFQEAGYHTALIGSNHILHDPIACGFETFEYHEWPWPKLPETDPNAPLRWFAGSSPFPIEESSSHRIADAVVRLIEQETERPLFVWASFFDPHPPYTPPVPYDALYSPDAMLLPENLSDDCAGKPNWIRACHETFEPLSEDDWRLAMACYYGQISFFDGQVGRIVAALVRSGRLDDTILIVTSDHGDYMAEHGMLEKFGSVYDSILRIPMILRGPSIPRAGSRYDGLVESIDLSPTLCHLCGIAPPMQMQGRDLVAQACGEAPARDAVFAEGVVGARMKPGESISFLTVRDQRFKLCRYSAGIEELYDLESDPGETVNLCGDSSCADIRARLYERAVHWMLESQDAFPWDAVPDVPHAAWADYMNAHVAAPRASEASRW